MSNEAGGITALDVGISVNGEAYLLASCCRAALALAYGPLDLNPSSECVISCCFDQGAAAHYRAALASLADLGAGVLTGLAVDGKDFLEKATEPGRREQLSNAPDRRSPA